MDANTQLASAVVAAVYLYEANYGSSSVIPYKNYVEAHYSTIEDPLVNGWWQPYCMHDENDELTLFPDLQMSAGDYFVPMVSGSNRY